MRELYYNLLSYLAPSFNKLYNNNLRVLAYHDVVDVQNFEDQISYLSMNFSIVSMSQIKNHLYNGKTLPKNALAITFDDGDYTLLEKGIAILKKYEVHSCVFVITELINSETDFWWNRVRMGEKENGNSALDVSGIINMLKSISNKDRLEKLSNYKPSFRKQLTGKDLKVLNSNAMIIANHSHTHPMFNKCTPQEIQTELNCTKRFFKDFKLGNYGIFAYPNGNYDDDSEKLLKENNIEMAFLFDHKINSTKIDPLRISRIRVDSDTKMAEFKVKVSGLHPFLYHNLGKK
ncbi:polysaccharide deacetylase family protein [Salinimicrobium sp. TIG7-5_MAKvit]|uniref:polysaccharide deacetylase family protein n=1 Tax=Salinimicrobium sp. TIG7-5_MAKvit TaxID=3121289 RepID=UPI003C6DD612